MDIIEVVESAWEKVCQDFDKACKENVAIYWNEEVLRLNFFQHLRKCDIKITWFSAELETYIWGKRYRPDLIVSFEVGGKTKRCVFEFKFRRSLTLWKQAWEDIHAYENGAFDYGFFIAIGPTTRVWEFPREIVKLKDYEAKALIYGKTWREAFGYGPPKHIAKELIRKTLKTPFHVVEPTGLALTIPKDYAIFFDNCWSKEGKCLLLLGFYFEPESKKWEEMKSKLKKAGFEKYVEFDEETFTFQPSETFTSAVLLEELESTTHPENVRKAKECLNRLIPLLTDLKPTLELC